MYYTRINAFPFVHKIPVLLVTLGLVLLNLACDSSEGVVRTVAEFNQAVEKAAPGDRITLANGVWRDAELLFEGKGTAEAPITLSVEEK